jgi:hypothetical protein
MRPLQNLIKHAFLSFRAREARHGIQYYQAVSGFRVKPGINNKSFDFSFWMRKIDQQANLIFRSLEII